MILYHGTNMNFESVELSIKLLKKIMTQAEYQFVVNHCVEGLVSFLMEDYEMSILEAFDKVYNSDTYQKLQNKRTGLYLRSAAYTYEYLKKELDIV